MNCRPTGPIAKCLLLTCGLAVTAVSSLGAAPPAADAKARVEIAQTTYFRLIAEADARLTAPRPPAKPGDDERTELEWVFDAQLAEHLHTWSCRWKEAQADLEGTPGTGLGAIEDHFARMQALIDGNVHLPGSPTVPSGGDEDPLKDFNSAIRGLAKFSEMPKETQELLSRHGDLEAFSSSLNYFRLEALSWKAKALAAH